MRERARAATAVDDALRAPVTSRATLRFAMAPRLARQAITRRPCVARRRCLALAVTAGGRLHAPADRRNHSAHAKNAPPPSAARRAAAPCPPAAARTQLLEEADVAPALQEFRSEGPNSLVAPLPAVAAPPPAPPPPELTAGNAASITGTPPRSPSARRTGTRWRFESVPEEGGRKRSTVVMAYDCLATARPGERFELRGRWEQHPKFGRQLRVDSQCARNSWRAISGAQFPAHLSPTDAPSLPAAGTSSR